jgi:hypothetical protein
MTKWERKKPGNTSGRKPKREIKSTWREVKIIFNRDTEKKQKRKRESGAIAKTGNMISKRKRFANKEKGMCECEYVCTQ